MNSLLYFLIPLAAGSAGTGITYISKKDTSLIEKNKVKDVLTKEEIKNLKISNNAKEVLNKVLEKGGKNTKLKLKKIIVKGDSQNPEMGTLGKWFNAITKEIVEEGFKNLNSEENLKNVGKYFAKEIQQNNRKNFTTPKDEELEIKVDEWVAKQIEPVIKEVLEGCGFYKKSWNWSAGVTGVFVDGVSWNKVQSMSLGDVSEDNIGRVYKNRCGINVEKSGFTWASYGNGQAGAGPTLQLQGLRRNDGQWDQQMNQLLKQHRENITEQLKVSFGIKTFVTNSIKRRFEQDWLKDVGQTTKIWEKRIDNVSWEI